MGEKANVKMINKERDRVDEILQNTRYINVFLNFIIITNNSFQYHNENF